MDMKLKAVMDPGSAVDRATGFYQGAGA